MTKRKKYDWEAIERDYRAGMLSIREISRKHDVPESSIRYQAKKYGWQRSLSGKVRERAQEKLLRKELRNPNANDDEVVEEAADTVTAVQLCHRKDIKDGRGFVELFYAHLREAAINRADIEDQIYEHTKASDPDGKDDIKARNAMLRAVSLPSHVGCLRDLSVALKNLVPLERQAFNMNDEDYIGRLGKGIGEGLAKASVEEASRIYAERLKG